MSYKIVGGNTTNDLVIEVKDHIIAGWRPIGGVAATQAIPAYIQAMVKGSARDA